METIMNRVKDHLKESLEFFPKNKIVTIALQGSQNYQLDTPESDVDTKLIVVPSFKDIVMNAKPVSTTHVRANNEHTDWKDIRLYRDCFRKQNLNFVEILFTPYSLDNSLYKEQWNRLREYREKIVRMNPYRAVRSMMGIALEKWHALEHHYPSKMAIIEVHGYDMKQLHHLLRIRYFLDKYIDGYSYPACMIPDNKTRETLIKVKSPTNPLYTLEEARGIGQETIDHIKKVVEKFCDENPEQEDNEMRELLDDVTYEIMRIAVKEELDGGGLS